ncbi:MAG: HAMP domain-containing histidine kinase [Chloroflexi bacterium]|nr:HAMP domain-containing histidine kinase [Chloroflexota bacterium]
MKKASARQDRGLPTPRKAVVADESKRSEALIARLRRLERRLAEEVAIADVQQRLLACVDAEQVADALLEIAPELTAAERCRLIVRRGDLWRCWDRAVGGTPQEYDLEPQAPLPSEVIDGMRPVLIPEWNAKSGLNIELADRLELHSYMALPVAAAGRLVGVFEAANLVHPEGIHEYAQIFGDILVSAATAIEVALLHEEVQHRAEDLSRLLRNVEDFTHAVSHDLRTPLAIVLGQAQLAERALTTDKKDVARRSLDAIVSSARRMNTMIEDLVDFARIETGGIQLHRRKVSLPQFVADLRQRLAGAVDVSRIEIVHPREPLATVSADPDRLERIFTNLLSNALKYSEGKVTVSFNRCGGDVETRVVDRGIGIEPEDLPRIFDRFYRAAGARKSEGLGLGLFITKLLIEAHGGKISAESEPGKGSTFKFTLAVS